MINNEWKTVAVLPKKLTFNLSMSSGATNGDLMIDQIDFQRTLIANGIRNQTVIKIQVLSCNLTVHKGIWEIILTLLA